MGCVETLIILSVAAFHFPVMPWGKWTDDFVADPVHFQAFLEKSGLLPVNSDPLSVWMHSIVQGKAFTR